MKHPDVCIAGAGLIGATLALELAARGLRVALLTDAEPLAHASTAAAGMLAVDDPDNPAALHALSALSRVLYPAFLDRLHTLGGVRVRSQTQRTLQSLAPEHSAHWDALTPAELHALAPQLEAGDQRFAALEEISLDPRELAAAVRAALTAAAIDVRRDTRVLRAAEHTSIVTITSSAGDLEAAVFLDCTGAWTLPAQTSPCVPVFPRKGQLLTMTLTLAVVIRTPSIYIVPRTHGLQAGRAVIGATVEDRGFDTTIEPAAIAALRRAATELLPALADSSITETWAGLRPATADGLPILGATGARSFIAKGHYRNGILLAPATAHVMAQLILGEPAAIDLSLFSAQRFAG